MRVVKLLLNFNLKEFIMTKMTKAQMAELLEEKDQQIAVLSARLEKAAHIFRTMKQDNVAWKVAKVEVSDGDTIKQAKAWVEFGKGCRMMARLTCFKNDNDTWNVVPKAQKFQINDGKKTIKMVYTMMSHNVRASVVNSVKEKLS